MIIRLIHQTCGQLWGKVGEKKVGVWGKEENLKLSTLDVSCPQSYPQSFALAVQRVIPQSTASTTITTLINIY